MRCSRILMLAVLAAAPTLANAQTPSTAPLAFTHVAVVDVERGRVLPDQTVRLAGNRIEAVGPSERVAVPRGVRVVDGRGKFLIPGLWDMHVHALYHGRSRWMFPLFLAAGVTGIRDMAAPLDSFVVHRDRLRHGIETGPRLLGTGPLLDAPPGTYPHLTAPIATAEAGRRTVDSLADAGVDFIKVYNGLSREAFFAIAAEAKRRGIPVVGHVPQAVTALEASDAGQKSEEHLIRVRPDACISDSVLHFVERRWNARFHRGMPQDSLGELVGGGDSILLAAFDERRCEAAGAHFARNGTWQVPTLTIPRHWTREFLASDTVDAEPLLRFVPAAERAYWRALADSVAADPDARYTNTWDPMTEPVLRGLRRGGAGILAGTDTDGSDDVPFGVPGITLHEELEAFVHVIGMTPAEALRTATLNPARFFGATDSLGTVAPGKLADLVLLDADPLLDIRNARRVEAVVANGRYLDRAALESLLEASRRGGNAATSADTLMVPVGGHRLRMVVAGEGPTTVVLEAGLGGGIGDWDNVLPGIARLTRVVAYDRAGYGGSDSATTPRTARRVATELHEALARANVAPPYVLVGHSLGGALVRVFAAMYPGEIAGLVLVDPAMEEFYRRAAERPEWRSAQAEQARRIAHASAAERGEWQAWDSTMAQLRAAHPLPAVPITVLTSMGTRDGRGGELLRLWGEVQTEWVRRTPAARQIVTTKSGHCIQCDEPGLVIDAVRAILGGSGARPR